jgi:hypothetical protein
VPLRAAAICGLLASVTFVVGLVLGDLAQPDAFSPANDDVSDIGALTADGAWLPTLLAVPVVAAANVLFSIVGDGAATRAGSITWFIWLGLVAFRLFRIAEGRTVGPAT